MQDLVRTTGGVMDSGVPSDKGPKLSSPERLTSELLARREHEGPRSLRTWAEARGGWGSSPHTALTGSGGVGATQ